MALIDHYIPEPHFRERHSRPVFGSSDPILTAAGTYRADDDRVFRGMIFGRVANVMRNRCYVRRQYRHRRPSHNALHRVTLLIPASVELDRSAVHISKRPGIVSALD